MGAHAKNFSLQHVNPDYIELTPFYDLICTGIYPTLSQKMAMKIGDQYHAEMIFPRHWQQLGMELDFTYPVLKKLIIKQGETLIKSAQLERENFMQIKKDISMIDKVIARLNENINETFEKLEKG
jgi:serine/threonine-protein kinase HipA